MSQFSNILADRHLPKHNGQPLWKYFLSDSEFFELKKHLVETKSLRFIDGRDCALYYAEWWKRYYNGGYPSKKQIFNTIYQGHFFDEDDFYSRAKTGANLLGIKWIRSQNTLYFKTLLLQGGLPIKHITNNKTDYKKFLLEILQINPRTIDDFAFNAAITSLLPPSSRNDEIYECCLDVIKAIINEDSDYLKLLDNNAELREISAELKIKKKSLNTVHRKTKIRTSWVLEPTKGRIRLYLGIPDKLDITDFKMLFFNADSVQQVDFEYKLFYNDLILCKFIKRADGNFRTVWINQGEIIWDGTEQYPDLRLHSTNNHQFDCKYLINVLPNLNKPTLWTKYSEMQWLLEKGYHTAQEEAYVLSPDNYKPSSNIVVNKISISERTMHWHKFSSAFTLSSQSEVFSFKSSCKKFEWYIIDEKPSWMLRTNLPVVQGKPRILVYDEKGNLIQNSTLKWRQSKTNFWCNWNGSIPLGLIEIQIQAFDLLENDEIFNVGSLDVEVVSNSLHQAEIKLLNNAFVFQINENPLVEIEKINTDKIRLCLKSSTSLPPSIQASIRAGNQSKTLRFEMYPPFKGVEIIDNNGIIVANNMVFRVNNLYGYRLMSNQDNVVTNMYNTRRKGIIISEKLTETFISLRTFEDKINQLYTLSDTMDSDAEIVLEIVEERNFRQAKLKEFRIKRYDQSINFSFNDQNKVIIMTKAADADLYAIPLDCSNEQINLYDLENNHNVYSFKINPALEKFIVFSAKESVNKVQPAFISLNPNNETTSPEDRVERVIALKDQLLTTEHEDDVWQRLLSYYKICLNNDLPYSTFDVLRAIGFSSTIAARSFVFLICYDDTQVFEEDGCTIMENDLGFSFHWVNKNDWVEAMEWIGCFNNEQLMGLVSSNIKSYFAKLHPTRHFAVTSNYVIQNKKPIIEKGFHLNGKISSLRASLGIKVLNELPEKSPKIPEAYKNILPVNGENANIKILIKSPLSVALSIAGKDETLWCKEYESIRRNIKYSQQLNAEWYGEALNYCLSKL